MADHADRTGLERQVHARSLHLSATLQGIAAGLVLGLGIFVATNVLVLKGGDVVGPHLALLGQFFIGYRVTFVGSLIGLAYGAIIGYLVGYFVARVYNAVADYRERRRPSA